MKQHLPLKIFSFFLLLLLIAIGIFLARNKPIWNDEIYSQTESIEQKTYADILLGKVAEGNNCPLFYILQKAITQVLQYDFPDGWEGRWSIYHPESQMILRIIPIFFISLSIICIFYFFAKNTSFVWGMISLFISLSTYMVWLYWAEARPYPLWFFFSTIQYLRILHIVKNGKVEDNDLKILMVVHIFMALTSVLSIAQIFIVCIFLWMMGERKKLNYLWIIGLPLVFCLYYYSRAPKYEFWFDFAPIRLITEALPLEQMVLIVGYAVVASLFYFFKKDWISINENKDQMVFVAFVMFILLEAFSLLGVLILKDCGGPQGFALSSRYFVFLSPLGIIAASFFSYEIFKLSKKNLWIVTNVIIVLAGFIILRAIKTFIHLFDVGLF